MNEVTICAPYRVEDCSAPIESETSLLHVQKVVGLAIAYCLQAKCVLNLVCVVAGCTKQVEARGSLSRVN
jgi:hypothetical protein